MKKSQLPKKIKDRVLYHIVWADSQSPSNPGWLEPCEIDPRVSMIDSVGYLAHENKESITLVAHLTDCGGQGMGFMTIPKSAIVKKSLLSIC